MIEYIEVRNSSLQVIGILDTAQSVIWHSVFFGVGDFQIYININDAVAFLSEMAYITRPDRDDVGVIESILVNDDVENGKMITIAGRFAKSILDRRIIYSLSNRSNKATILKGNVETEVRRLVAENAASPSDQDRWIDILELGEVAGIDKVIVDEYGNAAEKQVSFENLLEYTDSLLKEYGIAARVILGGSKLKYVIFAGTDRSVDNADGNQPIIFSTEYDNLLSSEYSLNMQQEKNVALVGGEGEGIDRFCVLHGSARGFARKEVFVDAKSITKKYKDASDVERTYTDAEYTSVLNMQGKQVTGELTVIEDFRGEIDVTNGNWTFGEDFFLGDIVTVQQNELGIFKNVRIAEVTEFQEEDGYTVEAVYQGE